MRSDIRGIQAWSLDGIYNSNTKQIAVFAAARNQYETADNLVYGIGKCLDIENWIIFRPSTRNCSCV